MNDAATPQEAMSAAPIPQGDGIELKEFHVVGNRIEARYAVDASKAIAGCFLKLCDEHGAQNYLEMQMHGDDGREVTVTVQRTNRPTAHQLRQQAEAALAASEARFTIAAQDKRRVDRLLEVAEQSLAALELAMDPRRWDRALSDAWHKNIPDTAAAFAALRDAAMLAPKGEGATS